MTTILIIVGAVALVWFVLAVAVVLIIGRGLHDKNDE